VRDAVAQRNPIEALGQARLAMARQSG
jgi:hypothetical protein